MLVDSASTDQTTEIATRYPISILKLSTDQRLTAAAGRYVGYHQTTGDLVLFLDGDMELYEAWLEQALQIMYSNPVVAVVTGKVIDMPILARAPIEKYREPFPTNLAGAFSVLQAGGAAIYRRSVMEKVGTFNPYLYSDEEPELCLRIRYAGYRILRLPQPIAFHYSSPVEAFSTLLGRRSRNLWLGFGQNIRYLFGGPLFWQYLRERGWVVPPALFLGFGIVAVLTSILTGLWAWFALWGVILIILTLGLTFRKRSLKRALFSLFQRLLIFEGTVRGLLLKPYDPANYPGRFDKIQ